MTSLSCPEGAHTFALERTGALAPRVDSCVYPVCIITHFTQLYPDSALLVRAFASVCMNGLFFFFCSRPQYLPVNLPGCFMSNVNRLVIYTTAFSHQLPVLRSCPDTQSSDHSFAELHTFLQLSPAYFSNVSSALR